MPKGSAKLWSAAAIVCIAAVTAAPAAVADKPPTGRTAAGARAAAHNDLVQIAALRADWERAVNARDFEGVLATYGKGAVIHAVGAPPLLGAADIEQWHRRWAWGAKVQYDAKAHLFHIGGRQAVEEWSADVTVSARGDARTGIGGDVFQFHQTGVRVYRKDQRGRWRIDRETWSADPPGVQSYAAGNGTWCRQVVC